MSIWDMYEEFSEKKGNLTELGEERQIGVTLGIVEENYNKDMPGMLKVRIPVRDEESTIVRWAKMMQSYTGPKWGFYFLPEKDDQVLLAYERGNVEKAYVIGAVPRDKDKLTSKSANEENSFKRIVTRHGTEVTFEDGGEEDGSKDKFYIRTAGKAWELTMNNEKQQMTLADKDKNCELILQAEKEAVMLRSKSKITLQAGDSAKIILNGDNGTVTVSGKKIVLQGDNSIEMKSNGTAKLSGQQVALDASSMLKAKSSGMTTIAGTPIKIG